ncbi:hypothetical protein CU098_007354 [Rhizopus stolonifer]|uniref:Retrotransposon gag domain-containing protein n=1 Tax=Rhizopus stolonifer TaxID=4846 RepID=A0A367J8J4_RHIST|nr:hypothetical protein CU098_007354 [Rhizopus stolonifer]
MDDNPQPTTMIDITSPSSPGTSTSINASTTEVWLKDTTATLDQAYTWANIKECFIGHYGDTIADEKTACVSELLNIAMGHKESIEAYIDRFRSLVRRSEIFDKLVLTNKFVSGLPRELNHVVNVAVSDVSSDKNLCLSTIIIISKVFYNKSFPLSAALSYVEECQGTERNDSIKTAKSVNSCFKCGAKPWPKDHVCRTGIPAENNVKRVMAIEDIDKNMGNLRLGEHRFTDSTLSKYATIPSLSSNDTQPTVE